jgi:hypothetical protein
VTSLTVTPEVVQEFIPCDEAKELIQSAWDKHMPGVYGNYNVYIGSCWYIEVPMYINHLIELGKEKTAARLLVLLLDDSLDHNKSPLRDAWQEMIQHRLPDRHYIGVEGIERLLEEYEQGYNG